MTDIDGSPASPGGGTSAARSRGPHDIFFAAVETTRMPMIVVDPHGDDLPIIFANHAFERTTGYAMREIVGRNCRFLQGPQTDRDVVAQVRRAIADKREVAVELLNYRKDGSTFWNALFVSPVFGPEGELLYYFASQLDVSRRRDAEDALRQAQKMEAIGQLTGGIAHDFNNLLQVVLGYVELLKGRKAFEEDPRLARAVNAIGAAAGKGATLTQQLLAFARKQDLQGRVVNLNETIDKFLPLIGQCAGDAVTVRTDLAPGLANCRLDLVQAEMAILNIVSNARDAMPRGGRLTVATFNDGNQAVLSIRDTGGGIPADIRNRVFDPFFTTKPVGEGTGLGLAMVYGFVKQSGGSVALESGSGGTELRLSFPAVASPRSAPEVSSGRGSAPGRGEHILLVEDQPEVAELAETLLDDLGYRVTVATGAEAALALLAGGERVDLMLTDVMMPGEMDGIALGRQVRADHSGVPVLLVTGYSNRTGSDAESQEFPVVHKPYRREELSAALRDELDRTGGIA